MENLLEARGELAVDIGTGWISRYEAGILKSGDVVRSETDAGMPQRVTLNGEYICGASVVIVDSGKTGVAGLFAKIEAFEPVSPPVPYPVRGEELTELLPFAIRLGSVALPIGSLSGAGRFSFLDLGKRFDPEEDATLVVAGVSLAAGKVVVIDERFGMRIKRRVSASFPETALRTTGSVLVSGYAAETIKDYDFTRPDVFTKRGILRVRDIHLEFLRMLQSRLPSASGYKIAMVDQLTYGEWRDALPAAGVKFASARIPPALSAFERERPLPAVPERVIIGNSAGTTDPEMIERFRNLIGKWHAPKAFQSAVIALSGPVATLIEEDPGLSITLACVRNGWKRVADFRFEGAAGLSDRPPGEEAAGTNEMIVLVRIEAAEAGYLDLVYPISLLQNCFDALNFA